jgi:hypothetical protein
LAASNPIPSRTKDIDDVDFSTGSVGLGVAITSFASIVQDYIKAKEWGGDRRLAAWSRSWATPSWTRAISTNASGGLEERAAQHLVDHRL